MNKCFIPAFLDEFALKSSISTFWKMSIVPSELKRQLALGGSVQCLVALGHFNCNIFIILHQIYLYHE